MTAPTTKLPYVSLGIGDKDEFVFLIHLPRSLIRQLIADLAGLTAILGDRNTVISLIVRDLSYQINTYLQNHQ
jgi:hypothetical protein